jgi:hypothetical protein
MNKFIMVGYLYLLGLVALIAPFASAQDDVPNSCVVNGVDIQDGGSYFQNSESSDPFSFVQYFEGMLGELLIWDLGT